MSLINACDNIKESLDFKFFELRKIKICNQLSNESIQNIAISNNIIFIATTEELKVIVVPLVLEFEWNNKVTTQILENYSSVIIPLSIKPHFLSICGGKNSILVVSGPTRVNSNLTQIQFFDLTDLNAVNSELKPFATLDLLSNNNEKIDILNLDWHPEYNESLFVAALSNGSLISVAVNLSKKHAKILCTLVHSEKIVSASWSPKGKQFVIGKQNGQLIQLKHKDGFNFEEAKKINPVPELAGYEINAVKWCFSNLFIVSFAKLRNENEFDVKHVTIYIPSKEQPIFSDHGSICIEQFNNNIRYVTNFVHLNNIILCSTSFSSEIGVLACDDTNKNLNNWCQLMLGDSFRIELPVFCGIQTLSKGLTMFLNETKKFKVNDTDIIGGKNCPLLMVMSSEGILCNYYIIYPSLTFNNILPTKQLEFQYIPQAQPANTSFQTPQKNIEQQYFNVNQTALSQQSQNLNQEQQNFLSQQKVQPTQENQQLIQQQLQEKAIALQNQQKQAAEEAARQAEIQKEKERREQIIEENRAYLVAIDDEVVQFYKLINESKKKYSVKNKLTIGKELEKKEITQSLIDVEKEIKVLNDRLKNLDVELLENFLFENFSMAENARSRFEKDNDTKFNFLFQKKPLDSVTTRKLKEINNKIAYIETNLQEISYILDQQWNEYVILEKGKKQNSASPVSLVYQTLASNHRILSSLEKQLRNIEAYIPWKDISCKLSYKKQDIKKIINDFSSKTNLNDDETRSNEDNLIEVNYFNKKSHQNLLRILDSRPEIPIKRSSLPVDLNSSIMISAISKAKEKLKLTMKKIEKIPDSKPMTVIKKPEAISKVDLKQNLPSANVNSNNFSFNAIDANLFKTSQPIKTNQNLVPIIKQPSSNKTNSAQVDKPHVIKPQTPIEANISPKISFNFNLNNQIKPISSTTSSKQNIDFSKVLTSNNDQLKNLPQKQPISNTQLPINSNLNTFLTPNQDNNKPVFSFKPDQLNLTFEKNNPGLISSTPIKSQSTNTVVKDSKTSSQQTIKTNNNDQIILDKVSVQKEDNKPKIYSPECEDISPAETPKLENKNLLSMDPILNFVPKLEDGKIDTSAFSFNALSNLSKLVSNFPVTSGTSIFNALPLTTSTNDSLISSTNNLKQAVNTESTAITTTVMSSNISFKPTVSVPVFAQNKTPEKQQLTLAKDTTVSSSNNLINDNKLNTSFSFNTNLATNVATSTSLIDSSNNIKPMTTPIFGQTDNSKILLNSKKTDVLPVSSAQNATISSSMATSIQPSFPIQNQQPISTASSFVSSAMSDVTSNQQPIQSFGFSMCSLGGKPNPENLNKNPFGGSISTTTQPSNITPNLSFGTQSSQNLFKSISTSNTNQAVQPAFTSISSTTNSAFGSGPTFGMAPTISSANLVNNFGSSNLNVGTSGVFGSMQTTMNQPATSAFNQQPKQENFFTQQNTFQQATQFGTTAAFGQAPTFGMSGGFNNSYKFGSTPVFGGNNLNSPNNSFGSIQKTGFESFANAANVPSFGSLNSPSATFEAIANNQTNAGFGSFGVSNQQTSAFGSPQQSPAFGAAQQNTTFGTTDFSFEAPQFSQRRA